MATIVHHGKPWHSDVWTVARLIYQLNTSMGLTHSNGSVFAGHCDHAGEVSANLHAGQFAMGGASTLSMAKTRACLANDALYLLNFVQEKRIGIGLQVIVSVVGIIPNELGATCSEGSFELPDVGHCRGN